MEPTPESRSCPRCGNPMPTGEPGALCPKCLLRAAMEEETQPLWDPQPRATGVGPTSRGLPRPGEQLGHYMISRTLGQGGMGAVYEAQDLDTGRRVALKVLSQALDEPGARQRFLREGRLAASINHPNSVYVFGTEEVAGTPVIAMELMPGGTLQDRVRASGPLPIPQAVDAALQIIAGLQAAQRVGILHRDIKPSNCFLGQGNEVKIGDFGLSISAAIRTEPAITATGAFIGTPAFCSPEQLRGEELNARSDMYSVGATLFFLLTGRTAFESNNAVQMLATILEQKPPSPRAFRTDVPQGLARIISRCMEKQSAERFRSYEELVRALAPYGSTAPTPATLGLRFLAGALDTLILSFVGTVLSFLTFGSPMEFLDAVNQTSVSAVLLVSAWLTVTVLYYGLMEASCGATVGKMICRLRVTGHDRSSLGIGQALARAAIFVIVPLVPFLGYYFIHGAPASSMAGQGTISQVFMKLAFYLVLGLLFSTARRRNGYAAVHDLITKTRVISRTALAARPSLELPDEPVIAAEQQPNLGPYHILETISSDGASEWLLGYDLRLLRKVWIRRTVHSAPAIDVSLRNLGRVGRIRWLTGRRSTHENWDAYEALTGKALLDLVVTSQDWNQVRFWLDDLATELNAALADGTLPTVLALDRVWITADGRAKLLDFPAPGLSPVKSEFAAATSNPGSTGSPSAEPGVNSARLLQEVAAVALSGLPGFSPNHHKAPSVPLPLGARRFLEMLPLIRHPQAVTASLHPLLLRPAGVTRLRRAAIMAGCFALPVVASVSIIFGTYMLRQWGKTNPGLLELFQTLQFREQSRRWNSMPRSLTDEQFAAYIGTHFGAVITNSHSWSNSMSLALINGEWRRFAEQSIVRAGKLDPDERRKASAAVEQSLPVSPLPDFFTQPWMPSMVAACALAFYVATPSVLAAVLCRGGLILLIAGVTFVRSDGALASRLRLFFRALVTWSSLALALGAFLLLKPVLGILGASIAAWLLLGVLAALSLALPRRGIADLMAGTWPVPR